MASSIATASSSRILVYLQRIPKGNTEKAPFKECILKYFGFSELEGFVSCTLSQNRLILSPSGPDSQAGVLLRHPPFCPINNLSPSDAESIPEYTLGRGVDSSVATLLWSSDRYLLLTRRASHLRIFPGLWVPPGGHIEPGESLVEAGLREMEEETGLRIETEHCHPSLVAMWESVYPPFLSRGLPKRHHIVVYQTVTSTKSHHELSKELCVDPGEVGAAAWLEESMVRAMTAVTDGGREDVPETIRAIVVNSGTQETSYQELSTAVFSESAPRVGEDIERLSTGTRFAMQQWCLRNPVT